MTDNKPLPKSGIECWCEGKDKAHGVWCGLKIRSALDGAEAELRKDVEACNSMCGMCKGRREAIAVYSKWFKALYEKEEPCSLCKGKLDTDMNKRAIKKMKQIDKEIEEGKTKVLSEEDVLKKYPHLRVD